MNDKSYLVRNINRICTSPDNGWANKETLIITLLKEKGYETQEDIVNFLKENIKEKTLKRINMYELEVMAA